MNYCILNGVKSTLIKGLLIQSLPPISKPLMRTQVEEIDGRDGDIVTKLGFSAYDKQMSIGLFGDFDIDQVIEFFNSEGTVIFSNEPDKYYQYQITHQIDFERLLRFRTATVTFHVQPFKFSAVDDVVFLQAEKYHPKTFSETQNGVTASVVNGALTVEGTATEDVMFYVPIEQMLIRDHRSYDFSWNGGEITADNYGSFEFAFVDKDNDIYFQEQTLSAGNSYSIGTSATFSRIYTYLRIKVAQGNTLKLSPTISVQDSVLGYNDISVINMGNTESRPIITISAGMFYTETRTAKLTLNGTELLSIVIHPEETIVLDCESMNAYYGNTFKNRSVTGDLSKVRFKTGENILRIRTEFGSYWLESLKIEKESRWI